MFSTRFSIFVSLRCTSPSRASTQSMRSFTLVKLRSLLSILFSRCSNCSSVVSNFSLTKPKNSPSVGSLFAFSFFTFFMLDILPCLQYPFLDKSDLSKLLRFLPADAPHPAFRTLKHLETSVQIERYAHLTTRLARNVSTLEAEAVLRRHSLQKTSQ